MLRDEQHHHEPEERETENWHRRKNNGWIFGSIIGVMLLIMFLLKGNFSTGTITVGFYGVRGFNLEDDIVYVKDTVISERTDIITRLDKLPYYDRWIYFWMFRPIYYNVNSDLIPVSTLLNGRIQDPSLDFEFDSQLSLVNPNYSYDVRSRIEEQDKNCNDCIRRVFKNLPRDFKKFNLRNESGEDSPTWQSLKENPLSVMSKAFFSFLRYKPLLENNAKGGFSHYKYTGFDVVKKISDKSVVFRVKNPYFKEVKFRAFPRNRSMTGKIAQNQVISVFSLDEFTTRKSIEKFQDLVKDTANFETFVLKWGKFAWIYVNPRLVSDNDSRRRIISTARGVSLEMYRNLGIKITPNNKRYLVPPYWAYDGWVLGRKLGLGTFAFEQYANINGPTIRPFPDSVYDLTYLGIDTIYWYDAEKIKEGFKRGKKQHSIGLSSKYVPYFIKELASRFNAEVREVSSDDLSEYKLRDNIGVLVVISESDPVIEFQLYSNVAKFLLVEQTNEILTPVVSQKITQIAEKISKVRGGEKGVEDITVAGVDLQNMLYDSAIIAPVASLPIMVQVRKEFRVGGKRLRIIPASLRISFRTGIITPDRWKIEEVRR